MPVVLNQTIMKEVYRIPSVTGYNRLEGAPRLQDFNESLKAEIRDPLWMLCRQWQFGEFEGEDAASPLSAIILGEHTPITGISLGGGPTAPYDETVPLEAAVEAEKLKGNLSLAVQIARYFIRLIKTTSLASHYLTDLKTAYPFNYKIDSNDQNGNLLFSVANGQLFDGYALLTDINTPTATGNKFLDGLKNAGADAADLSFFSGITVKLTNWYNRNYQQPAGNAENTAWNSKTLDYAFKLSSAVNVTEQRVLTAPQFYGGHLDWYSFDLDSTIFAPPTAIAAEGATVAENLVSFIPSPVTFKGMPNPRFWMMEDSQTDFGAIDTTPTGLLHLLLAEFGLIYGNDWFMLPYPLSINNICEIKGLIITDVFGQNTWIDAAGAGADNDWQRWAMFHQTDVNTQLSPNKLFYLAPAVTVSLENDPLEQVNFLRDEVADMVWAVEDTVPSQAGMGVSGNEMALKPDEPPVFVPAGTASIRYLLGTTVPDNWIPFIPVHIEGSTTEIQFQRAGMPGAKGALGQIVSETPAPYYINEEEIPRSGTIIQRAFRRARWLNGQTFLWLARSRDTGKGEGLSNLKFDQIVAIPKKKAK